jgi:hypothetical protein
MAMMDISSDQLWVQAGGGGLVEEGFRLEMRVVMVKMVSSILGLQQEITSLKGSKGSSAFGRGRLQMIQMHLPGAASHAGGGEVKYISQGTP